MCTGCMLRVTLSNHCELLAGLKVLQLAVKWRKLLPHAFSHDYLLIRGNSQLTCLQYVLGIWCCYQPHLAEVLDSIQAFIRAWKLWVWFKWVARKDSSIADWAADEVQNC